MQFLRIEERNIQ